MVDFFFGNFIRGNHPLGPFMSEKLPKVLTRDTKYIRYCAVKTKKSLTEPSGSGVLMLGLDSFGHVYTY